MLKKGAVIVLRYGSKSSITEIISSISSTNNVISIDSGSSPLVTWSRELKSCKQ